MKRLLVALMATTALMSTTVYAQTESTAQTAPAMQQTGAATTVSDVKGKPVLLQNGSEAGQVSDVIVDSKGMHYFVVSLSSDFGGQQVPLPAMNIVRDNDRFLIVGLSDAQLRQIKPYQQAEGIRPLEETAAIIGMMPSAGDQQGQQVAAADPNAPQVFVQQATPEINITQGQPEVIVRQAPPTITIEMPQPEIVLRMPPADVNVSLAKPEVRVTMPEPQVTIAQPEMAPQAMVQRGQPKVTYERTGDPKLVFNQAQGQPQVRIEQMNQNDSTQAAADNTTGSGDQTAPAAGTSTSVQNQTAAAQNQTPASAGETTGSIATPTRAFVTTDLEGKNVYNLRGDNLGEIQDVFQGPGSKVFMLVEFGGFLGLGERRVLLPAENFAWRGDRLLIPGMSEEELKAQAAWNENSQGYAAVDNNFSTELNIME